MTLRQKLLTSFGIILVVALFALLLKQESPSPSLGATSLANPAYVVTSTATSATTTIYSFAGVLHTLTVTKPTASDVITVYDSATTTSPTIAPIVITIPASPTSTPVTLTFDGIFNNGLTVQQSATSTITVTYQQF